MTAKPVLSDPGGFLRSSRIPRPGLYQKAKLRVTVTGCQKELKTKTASWARGAGEQTRGRAGAGRDARSVEPRAAPRAPVPEELPGPVLRGGGGGGGGAGLCFPAPVTPLRGCRLGASAGLCSAFILPARSCRWQRFSSSLGGARKTQLEITRSCLWRWRKL